MCAPAPRPPVTPAECFCLPAEADSWCLPKEMWMGDMTGSGGKEGRGQVEESKKQWRKVQERKKTATGRMVASVSKEEEVDNRKLDMDRPQRKE